MNQKSPRDIAALAAVRDEYGAQRYPPIPGDRYTLVYE